MFTGSALSVDEIGLRVGDEAVMRGASRPTGSRRCCVRSRLVTSIAALALFLAACSGAATPTPSAVAPSAPASSVAPASAAPGSLTIYAAASLKAVLARVKTAYEAANPGTTLTISTDSSSALETKIEQGAPADVFLSADTANPQKLVDKGLAAGSLTLFAGNHLTIIVPAANPAGDPDARRISPGAGSRSSPPATRCRSRSTRPSSSRTSPGSPATRPTSSPSTPRTSSRKEDNVAAVVAKIELGEGDAGIVYVTDAKTSTKVTTIAVPDAANVPATYAGVVVKASTNGAAAQAFLAWLGGPDGQAILASFGFLPTS